MRVTPKRTLWVVRNMEKYMKHRNHHKLSHRSYFLLFPNSNSLGYLKEEGREIIGSYIDRRTFSVRYELLFSTTGVFTGLLRSIKTTVNVK